MRQFLLLEVSNVLPYLLLLDNLQRRGRRPNELYRRSACGHAITGSAGHGPASAADRISPGASVRRSRRQRHDDGYLRSTVVVVDVVVVTVDIVSSTATAAAAATRWLRDAYKPHCQLPAADHVTGRHSSSLLEPRRHRVMQAHPRQIHRYRTCTTTTTAPRLWSFYHCHSLTSLRFYIVFYVLVIV